MTKYRAKKTVIDGVTFDSKKEAQRWVELKGMEQLGAIKNLRRQVPFELIPKQTDPETGKTIERAVTYKADFVYEQDGKTVVEDVKGIKTLPEYVLKRKMMLFKYGIVIKET